MVVFVGGLLLVAATLLLQYGFEEQELHDHLATGSALPVGHIDHRGAVEVVGRAEPDGPCPPAPGTDRPCVAWRVEIVPPGEGPDQGEETPDERILAEGFVPFTLVDDRGSLRVDPEGADLLAPVLAELRPSDLPAPLGDDPRLSPDARVVVLGLPAGGITYAFGDVEGREDHHVMDAGDGPFVLSHRPRLERAPHRARGANLAAFTGVVCALAGLLLVVTGL